jgi:hypothetical protein
MADRIYKIDCQLKPMQWHVNRKKNVYMHREGLCYDFLMHINLILRQPHLLAHPVKDALLWEMIRHSSVKEMNKAADCVLVDA